MVFLERVRDLSIDVSSLAFEVDEWSSYLDLDLLFCRRGLYFRSFLIIYC